MKLSNGKLLKFRYDSEIKSREYVRYIDTYKGKSIKHVYSYTGEYITTTCLLIDESGNESSKFFSVCSPFDYFDKRIGKWKSIRQLIEFMFDEDYDLSKEILENFISYKKNSKFVSYSNSEKINILAQDLLSSSVKNYDNIGI